MSEYKCPCGNILCPQPKEVDELKSEVAALREALEFCANPIGAYKLDPGEHAIECLKEVVRIARSALEGKAK